MRSLGIFCLILLMLCAPVVIQAQIPTIVPCNGVDCTVCDIARLAQNLLNAAIYLAVFFSAFLFAYAGFLYLTNEAIGQQQKAKQMFTNVLLGMVVLMGAWLFVDTVMKMLMPGGAGGGYFPWNSIC